MEMGILPKRACSSGVHALVTICALLALGMPPGSFAANRVVLCEEFSSYT